MAKQKDKEASPTEQKIRDAARRLFTEKGYDAVKTRDIAAEAGINIALLNYYFRSKEKLFEIIIAENFDRFIDQLLPVLGNEEEPFERVLEKVTVSYIDMLKANRDLPFFILGQMRGNGSESFLAGKRLNKLRDAFLARMGKNMPAQQPQPAAAGQMMLNFMGLLVFPFLAQPLVMKMNNMNKTEFDELIESRKKLVPVWLKAILAASLDTADEQNHKKNKGAVGAEGNYRRRFSSPEKKI